MTSLAFGFYGEGNTEYSFLIPLIERVLQMLLPDFDILPISIRDEDLPENVSGDADKIEILARTYFGYGLLVYHIDADDRTAEQALQNRFLPGYQRIQQAEGEINKQIVPVIPVRMTDAWMLVDFQAFKQTVGTHKTARELGFPEKPRLVEALQDPKRMFRRAFDEARSGRQHRRAAIDTVFGPLAARIDLRLLEQVPAYNKFTEHLVDVLRAHKYLID